MFHGSGRLSLLSFLLFLLLEEWLLEGLPRLFLSFQAHKSRSGRPNVRFSKEIAKIAKIVQNWGKLVKIAKKIASINCCRTKNKVQQLIASN